MRISRTTRAIWMAAAALLPVQLAQTQTITALNPNSANAGGPAFLLLVSGYSFVSGTTVTWNSISLPTQVNSSTVLSVPVAQSMIATPGTVLIAAVNPNGSRSNTMVFTIQGTVTIASSTLPAGIIGRPYTTTLAALGGVPEYSWYAVDPLPAGLSLSSNGTLSGTPSAMGTFHFTVRVMDRSLAGATRLLSLTIGPPALSIRTESPLPPARLEQPYSQALAAAGGAEPYRWTASSGIPPGLVLNPSTGVLSGTPQIKGSYTFTVQAADSNNASVTKDFSLAVKPPVLAIATEPPLFSATAGTAYSQPFTASGGTPPYRWSLASGQVGGLTMDSNSGNIAGIPAAPGSFPVVVQVDDSAGERARKSYVLLVNPRSMSITTAATLPKGTVGIPYAQALTASGGTAPLTWSITAGWIPGVKIDPVTGILGQTPTEAGTFSFVVEVRDGAGLTASKSFTVTISPAALLITSSPDLPGGRIGKAYSQALCASGGVPPYSWTATGLPAGLSLDASNGSISGIPAAPGSFSFAVRVTDSARVTALTLLHLDVDLPQLPSISIHGAPEISPPARQHRVQVTLDAPYPVPLAGSLLLSFAPEAGGGDNTIQFSSGGRSASFQIPEGATEAVFEVPDLAFQTGTVAGVVQLTVTLQSGGVDITPPSASVTLVRIERAAPSISRVKLIPKTNGFDVQLTGYCTSRELTEAVFRFSTTGGNTLQQPEVRVALESMVAAWFQDSASFRYGSQFTFTQPFTVQGDAQAVNFVSVTLTNRLGSATATVTP